GLPGPGRADQREDDAGAPAVLHAALGAQLAYAEVFGDAPLHLLEALVVGVEHAAGLDGIEAVRGPLPPGHREEPVEVGADHRGLRALLAHAVEALELALGLRAHGLRDARVGDAGAVLLRDGGVVLAELFADGVHLFAQEVLPLLLLGSGLDVLADALAHLQLGQPLAL